METQNEVSNEINVYRKSKGQGPGYIDRRVDLLELLILAYEFDELKKDA